MPLASSWRRQYGVCCSLPFSCYRLQFIGRLGPKLVRWPEHSWCNVGIAMPCLPSIFDGWNPTHKNGDDLGMVQLTLLYRHYQSQCDNRNEKNATPNSQPAVAFLSSASSKRCFRDSRRTVPEVWFMDPTTFWNWVSVVLARFQIEQSRQGAPIGVLGKLSFSGDFSARHALIAVGLASLSSSPSG